MVKVKESLADDWLPCTSCQVTQIVSQQQVQAELTLRLTQLQTRLASLKIENEEVRHLVLLCSSTPFLSYWSACLLLW